MRPSGCLGNLQAAEKSRKSACAAEGLPEDNTVVGQVMRV